MRAHVPQIVIPMSGFGERFRRAGYEVPKPLIPVDGKPIIQHVVEMFPGATDITFVCNRDHLADPGYGMRDLLQRIAPTARIVAVEPHRLGPVHAVGQALPALDPARPVIVNYCDFSCYWHYDDFLDFVTECDCDGAIPAYRGFHPHSLGSTFYAYLKEDGLWASDIREKQPFTDRPSEEFASSGTYYFRSARLLAEACAATIAENLSVNGEYYVSLAYKPLMRAGRRIAVYSLQHFMQWGTPEDLEEYLYWSRVFGSLVEPSRRRVTAPQPDGCLLVPLAGLGKRFAVEGYADPKPLIPVSGRPMVVQAALDLPRPPEQRFILRRDLAGLEEVQAVIRTAFPDASLHVLDGITDGQARTCLLGLDGVAPDEPLTIIACDNGMVFEADAYSRLLGSLEADVIVWGVRGHPLARRRPEMFGWIDAEADGRIRRVSTKVPLDDPARDPVVVGAFTFRHAADFVRAAERMIARDGRINGEFYVDNAINDALELGLSCRLFEIDAYLCWGTPDDLRTFEYWQACFDKWFGHPYRLEDDSRVAPEAIPAIRARYAWKPAPRPSP